MKKNLTLLLLLAAVLPALAQTDVSKYYLANYGFDTDFDYPASSSANVSQEIKQINGWTPDLSADYTITGVYEFGFKGTYNNATVPAKGYDDEPGGGLALSTGWEQTFCYYQTVTLPAGKYTLKVPTYNGKTKSAGVSQMAWIPTSGTAVRSTVSSYPSKQWTLDQISFTLTKTTKGKIQIGYKAAAGGSANSANLLIDYVQLLVSDMAVDKSSLQSLLTQANTLYGDGSGNGAAELKAAIDEAKTVFDNEAATMIEVLEATEKLQAAIDVYRKQNISEENPYDCTEYIENPSFEVGGTAKWTVVNLVSQSNSSFTQKAGAVYIEKWVSQGTKVGDASVVQRIQLPRGKYKLTVAAQNLNQSSTSQRCTGAYIFAGDQKTTVYTPNDYSVKFTSISGEEKIGFIAQSATGNWLAVDNFRLYKIGEISAEVVIEELQRIIADAEVLQAKMMSTATATALATAIANAKLITTSSSDEEIQSATKNLREAMAAATISIAEYEALQAAIDEAVAVYDASKQGADEFLAVIEMAQALVKNGEATTEQLADAIEQLVTAALLFKVANGTGTAPQVTTKAFYVPAAHGALIRATFTGGSSYVERGICWSTEKEPTIADHRSTDYYTLNGPMFHIKDMQPASVYYARAYAITRTYAVGYGEVVKVVTLPQGSCVGTWDNGAPTDEANARCKKAIQETMDYLNEWTAIKGFTLSGHYGSGTPTADCSYGGWMRIGPNAAYQAIGTVLHETGHGVGVGTHWRWYDCADTRENTTHGKWLGAWANQTLRFLENTTSQDMFVTGDAVHGWGSRATYDWFVNGADKDTHTALQYIGGCALLYSLYIDGLCPTSGYSNGVPGYTFNYDEGKKYYLKSESANHGLDDGYLFERSGSMLRWTKREVAELNDSLAWYVEFVPSTGHYRFRNAATGKYISRSGSMLLKAVTTPGNTENFQLMPGRNEVVVTRDGKNIYKAQSYWITFNESGDKSLQVNNFLVSQDCGTVTKTSFNYSNGAKTQRYIIVSEDDISAFAKEEPDAIVTVRDKESSTATPFVVGIYTMGGVKLQEPVRGMNIIRYSDGTSRVVMK